MLNPTKSRCALCLFLALIPVRSKAQGPTLAGTIVEDSTSAPVASAELKIHKPGQRELVADLEADGSGRIPGVRVPAGDYTAEVTRPNFIATTFPLHIPDTTLQIRLLRYASIDGKVVNSSGQPVAGSISRTFQCPGGGCSMGADVGGTHVAALAKQPGTDEFRIFREAEIQKDGAYHLQDLSPGEYQLRLTYFGLSEGAGMQLYPDSAHPRTFEITGGEALAGVNFLVPSSPTYKVGGRVELPEPNALISLSLVAPDQPGFAIGRTFNSESGSFRFDAIPSGSYDLLASFLNRNQSLFARQRIQVSGADLTDLIVTVSPGKSIGITLRAHGTEQIPAACPQTVTVSLIPLEPWRTNDTPFPAQAALAKPQATPNLPPGKFRLIATGLAPGCYAINQPEADLGSEATAPIVIELAPAGSIKGTVHGASAVLLLDTQSRLASADDQGHFAFENLAPGHYRLAPASATRWIRDLSQMKEVEVTGGAETNVELQTK